VPDYLGRLPLDPFSGSPLVYKQTGTNWLLYSVGVDGVDGGGKPVTRVTDKEVLPFVRLHRSPRYRKATSFLIPSGERLEDDEERDCQTNNYISIGCVPI
jgi:hypothetical protein